VANRNLERATLLAESLGASTLPFEDREAHLGDYDIIVCSTSAPTTVVSARGCAERDRATEVPSTPPD